MAYTRFIAYLAAALAACSLSASTAHAESLLLVLNKSGDSMSMLHPDTGETVAEVAVGAEPHEAAVSPDGKLAVVCNYGGRFEPGSTLSVVDVPERRVVRTIELGEHTRPHGIVFLSDGRRVVVTTEGSRSIVIVDAHTGEIEAAIGTDQNISHMVAVTADERLAFVANIASHSVSVVDLEKQELVKVVETGPQAEGVAVHPNRPEVWVSNRMGHTVSVIDIETLEVTHEMDCGLFPIRVVFTPDGSHALVSCARSGDVAVFDGWTREEVNRIPMEVTAVEREEMERRLFGTQFGDSPVPIGLLVRPDGKRAYVANTNADIVTVIDTETWEVVDRFKAGREPDGLAWSTVGE